MSRDDAGWQEAGAGPPLEDRAAPLARLEASVEATPRYPRDYVRLRVRAEPLATVTPARYRVRAVAADGPGPPSATAFGYRGIGDRIAYGWQRSPSGRDADFVDLPDVTGAIWFDDTGAPPAEARYYRAVMRADGAQGVSAAVRAETIAFRRLSGGRFRTCGVRTDARVICWGDDFLGSPADAPTIDAPSADGFKTFSAGVSAGCGVRDDDRVVCWGNSSNDETPGPTPTEETFSDVGIGVDHGCGLRLDGTLVCWGCCGSYDPPPGTFKALSVGGSHACAIGTDDRVVCWGDNDQGQAPPEPSADRFKVVRAAWGPHSCGIRSDDGALICWGDDSAGQAPAGPTTDTFVGVGGGARHTCALRADGRILCFGDDTSGQAPPALSADTFVDVVAGERHSCGLLTDGRVRCWGGDDHAELPVVPPADRFRSVSVGATLRDGPSVCGIRLDGRLVCWGNNQYGQAPRGPSTMAFQGVGASYAESCALGLDGRVLCQGRGFDGPDPQVVAQGLTSVSLGYSLGCGLRDDGFAVCWPLGNAGDAVAVPPPPDQRLVNLDVGGQQACGVRPDGKIVLAGAGTPSARGPRVRRPGRTPRWRPDAFTPVPSGWTARSVLGRQPAHARPGSSAAHRPVPEHQRRVRVVLRRPRRRPPALLGFLRRKRAPGRRAHPGSVEERQHRAGPLLRRARRRSPAVLGRTARASIATARA